MKITIVTIAFNAEATIADAVASVISQKRDGFDLEYIVVDGASSDGTLDAIEPYRNQINQLISEPDQGLYDAMNKGLRAATGDFVGILNADDLYAGDDVLQKVAAQLSASGADSLYGDLVYVDRHATERVTRRWVSGTFHPRSFLRGWMPPHPTFFMRRDAVDQFGEFSLKLSSAADYELMLRMLCKHGLSTVYLPEVLVRMRVGGMSNASWGNRWRANREDREAWRMNGLRPWPWTVWMKPLRKLPQLWSR